MITRAPVPRARRPAGKQHARGRPWVRLMALPRWRTATSPQPSRRISHCSPAGRRGGGRGQCTPPAQPGWSSSHASSCQPDRPRRESPRWRARAARRRSSRSASPSGRRPRSTASCSGSRSRRSRRSRSRTPDSEYDCYVMLNWSRSISYHTYTYKYKYTYKHMCYTILLHHIVLHYHIIILQALTRPSGTPGVASAPSGPMDSMAAALDWRCARAASATSRHRINGYQA